MAQIRIKVRLSYRGRYVDAVALHDTGAETYAFVDSSIAEKLGLPRGEAIGYAGIAGSSVGFKSEVDSFQILDNPDCSLGKMPVVVGRVSVPNVQLLVGEYFMRSVGMTTEVTEDGISISCRKGQKVAIVQPIPEHYWLLGGAAVVLAVLGFVFLRD